MRRRRRSINFKKSSLYDNFLIPFNYAQLKTLTSWESMNCSTLSVTTPVAAWTGDQFRSFLPWKICKFLISEYNIIYSKFFFFFSKTPFKQGTNLNVTCAVISATLSHVHVSFYENNLVGKGTRGETSITVFRPKISLQIKALILSRFSFKRCKCETRLHNFS